jgi:aryl-alcohol dehydrogenase-like predicted oxidoreductase
MISRDNRDQVFLATKYSGSCKVARPGNISSNWRGDGLKAMRLSIETSLKRLQTTFIDLFYLHAWDYTVSIPELMMGLNDLVSSGKVNYLGVSDTPAWVVAKANQYARDHGLRQFSVYQGMWNAGMRDFERDIIPMAMHEGMALAPYGTLGQGSFQTREGYAERAKSNPGRNLKPTSETDRKVSGVLEDLACERNDGTTLLNVALAYVMQKVPYVFPIVGARKVEHLEGSIQGLKVTLSQEEIERIENAVDFEHGFPTNFLNHALVDPSSKNVMVLGPESVKHNMLSEFDYVMPPSAIRFTQ